MIRRAREHDRPALERIYRRASLSNPGDRAALVAHPELLRLDEGLISRGRTWVATLTDETPIGFASTHRLDNRALELDDLFVDPSRRRLGAARLLVERIVREASQERMTRIEVTGNTHAMSFYRAVGFGDERIVTTALGAGVRMQLHVPAIGGPQPTESDLPAK